MKLNCVLFGWKCKVIYDKYVSQVVRWLDENLNRNHSKSKLSENHRIPGRCGHYWLHSSLKQKLVPLCVAYRCRQFILFLFSNSRLWLFFFFIIKKLRGIASHNKLIKCCSLNSTLLVPNPIQSWLLKCVVGGWWMSVVPLDGLHFVGTSHSLPWLPEPVQDLVPLFQMYCFFTTASVSSPINGELLPFVVQNARHSSCGGRVSEWVKDRPVGGSFCLGLSTPLVALTSGATLGSPWVMVGYVVFLWSQFAWCITHHLPFSGFIVHVHVSSYKPEDNPRDTLLDSELPGPFIWGSIRELETTCECKCTYVHSQHICWVSP